MFIGHYINYCPTNGDPSFDKVKKSTGIPKIFLKPVEGGQTMVCIRLKIKFGISSF